MIWSMLKPQYSLVLVFSCFHGMIAGAQGAQALMYWLSLIVLKQLFQSNVCSIQETLRRGKDNAPKVAGKLSLGSTWLSKEFHHLCVHPQLYMCVCVCMHACTSKHKVFSHCWRWGYWQEENRIYIWSLQGFCSCCETYGVTGRLSVILHTF